MRKYFIITTCLLAAAIAGCKKNYQSQPEDQGETKTIRTKLAVHDGMTVLGDRLKNPYTVVNMEWGKRELDARGIKPEKDFKVRETHLYVKFMPEDEEEYNALEADISLDLVDFPLDYDIKLVGNYYRDPELDESTPSPQYAVVPSDFRFSDKIKYEVIDPLYIPQLDPDLMDALGENEEDHEYLRQLMYETYGLNPPNNRFPRWQFEPAQTGANDGFSGGGPDGYVRVFDTRLNKMVPLKGADILVLNGMGFFHGTTDNNGQYWLDNWFQGNSIVMVKMRKSDFTIRKNFFDNVSIARPGNGTYLDIDIENGMERMYATMFRAAYRYCYGYVGGLQRPKRPVFKQVLVAKDDVGSSSGFNNIVWPSLKVWRYRSNNVEYGSDEIFSTTIHELAHTAHVKTMNAGAIQYSQMDNIIRESWPIAVEWFITGMEYRENGIGNYGDWNYNPPNPPQYPNQFSYQYWDKGRSADYTSLFINLVDNLNEDGMNLNTNISPVWGTINDQVRGYNLATIQSVFLKHVYGLSSLKTQLKANKPAGVTDAQIDLLISQY